MALNWNKNHARNFTKKAKIYMSREKIGTHIPHQL